jgi:hypothetical protein
MPNRVLDVLVPEIGLEGTGIVALGASANPQACRSMCGCALKASPPQKRSSHRGFTAPPESARFDLC